MMCEVLPFLWKELGAWAMYRDAEALRILKQKHKSRTQVKCGTFISKIVVKWW